MKPLLIGEAPSKNENIPRPLEGRIGHRLAKFAGITFEEYLELFDRVNLLTLRQDTAEKGFEFDMELATISAGLLRQTQPERRYMVLLGKRVAEAFRLPLFYFEEMKEPDHTFIVMPHPSGVNRWFNDSRNLTEAQSFMRRMVEQAKEVVQCIE
jgi:hypothetical protein